ncbi:MAG: hypothetical protein HN417_09750 [Desulfobacula sp.]|nr:hypothetical protein [Desulfobacula sp.]
MIIAGGANKEIMIPPLNPQNKTIGITNMTTKIREKSPHCSTILGNAKKYIISKKIIIVHL